MRTVTGIRGTINALAAIFWKGMKHYTRYPGGFLLYLILPFLFTILIFGMGRFIGGGNATLNFAARTGTTNVLVYEMLGSAVWMTGWVVVDDVAVALRDEQMKGTLEQNFLAPVNRFTLLVGISLTDIAITTSIFFIVVGVTLALTMPGAYLGLIQAFLMLLIGLIPLFGIGFLFAGFVIKFKEPYVFTQMVNLIFGALTGTYYPVTILPYWVQFLSGALPQTYVISNMRQIVLANQTLVSLYGSIFILLALALVYPTIGYAVFKKLERNASVTGELSKY
ncbi:MAG: ABC transporter permease [Candidatus Bathyarchaeia archaeon]|jgi:ABC-2 type transport system permease protein